MADPWHLNWLSEGVERWNRRRKKVDFSPDLTGVRFFDLLPPDFRESPKTSRFFEGINLSHANLAGADLSGINFHNAKFAYSDLSGADMSMSNFVNAKFTQANLTGVDLSHSLLGGAIFEKSILDGVSFEQVDISHATFISTDFDERQESAAHRQLAQVFIDRNALRAETHLIENREKLETIEVSTPLEARASPKPKNRYDVFFGTNRSPVFERGVLVDYDANISPNLNYGVCEVIVPDGHRIGSLGSPMWKRLLNRKDDRLRVESIISLNAELFRILLHETSRRMKKKERPTIFVHGFNNTFEQGALRAAQIGYDLGIGQGIALFSWPSKGSIFGYSADEAPSEASKYALAKFIEEFVLSSKNDGINVIAHSMGCRVVLGAIELLSANKKSILKKINNVIFAAADVDSAIMPHMGMHAIEHSGRTTSYVSDRDKALKVSGWLHKFPRVGITPPTFILDGMDTIVVNSLDLGEFAHGYLGTSRAILGDIFALLKANTPPNERHAIEAVTAGTQQYWRIKE